MPIHPHLGQPEILQLVMLLVTTLTLRYNFLSTCKLWPALQSKVAEKSAKISLLEKASCENL
jgi:hypothetical protein